MFQIFISLTFGNVLIFIQIVLLSSLYWFVLVPVQLLSLIYSYSPPGFISHFQKENFYSVLLFIFGLKYPSLSHAILHLTLDSAEHPCSRFFCNTDYQNTDEVSPALYIMVWMFLYLYWKYLGDFMVMFSWWLISWGFYGHVQLMAHSRAVTNYLNDIFLYSESKLWADGFSKRHICLMHLNCWMWNSSHL